jgi:hypothetical protein
VPKLAESSRNCTLAIPALDEAEAVTVMVPETVDPSDGELIETVGGVVGSPSLVAKLKSPLVTIAPDASRDFTW